MAAHSAVVRLAVDVGSSSVRCTALKDCSSDLPAVLAQSRVPVALSGDGTFDAPGLLADVRAAVAACIASVPDAADAAAVAELHLTTFVGNLVAVGASGSPVSPLFTYAQRHPPPRLPRAAAIAHYDRTGTPVHSAYAAAFAAAHRATAGGGAPAPAAASAAHRATAGGGAPAPAAASAAVDVWTGLSGYLLASWAAVHPRRVGLSASEAGWAGLLRLHPDGATGDYGDGSSALDYDDGALSLAGISRDQLPPIRGDGFALSVPLAALIGGAEASWSNSATVRVTLAIGDGAAATVGSLPRPWRAHADGGVFALTVGTSAALRAVLPRRALLRALCACAATSSDFDSDNTVAAGAADNSSRARCLRCGRLRLSRLGLWAYPFADGVMLVGGALTDGGSLTSHVAAALGTSPAATTDAIASSNDNHSTGGGGGKFDEDSLRPSPVLCLPFWSGERSTGWQGGARGVWAGLDYANTRPEALLHAAMDGVAFRLRAILDALRTVVVEAATAAGACDGSSSPAAQSSTAAADGMLARGVCSGGGLDPRHNALFSAILATVLDVPLYIQHSGDGAAPAYKQLELTTRGLVEFHTSTSAAPAPPLFAGSSSIHSTNDTAPALELVRAAGADARRAYAAAYVRHQRLYDALSGVDLSC
jgi:sugar (pentulose or hexulose) kinase